jgi:D-lactate dehydrogenase
VISVHCPLNSETKYMFNKRSFSMMKGVLFINTARGTVVNTEDLIDALKIDISSSRFRRLWKGKNISLVTTLQKMGIIYTLSSLLPKCVNYRTPRLFTNEALEGIAHHFAFNAWTWTSLKTNLNNSFQIIIQTLMLYRQVLEVYYCFYLTKRSNSVRFTFRILNPSSIS